MGACYSIDTELHHRRIQPTVDISEDCRQWGWGGGRAGLTRKGSGRLSGVMERDLYELHKRMHVKSHIWRPLRCVSQHVNFPPHQNWKQILNSN